MLVGLAHEHMLMGDPSQAAAKPNWRWRVTKPSLVRSTNSSNFSSNFSDFQKYECPTCKYRKVQIKTATCKNAKQDRCECVMGNTN